MWVRCGWVRCFKDETIHYMPFWLRLQRQIKFQIFDEHLNITCRQVQSKTRLFLFCIYTFLYIDVSVTIVNTFLSLWTIDFYIYECGHRTCYTYTIVMSTYSTIYFVKKQCLKKKILFFYNVMYTWITQHLTK
mgnify:CR=1 FL=1